MTGQHYQSTPSRTATASPPDNVPTPVAGVAYDRGLRLLAELLAREAYTPESTVAALRKYFPVLCGVRPRWLKKTEEAEWLGKVEYYTRLIEQLGRTGSPPKVLLRAVKRWEHGECGRAMDQKKGMPGLPLAPWRLAASEEWKAIQQASRAGKPLPPPRYRTDALRERRRKVEEHLRAHPELRQTFEIEGAPLEPGPGMPVSVVIAVRSGERIASSELLIPRENFRLAAFLREIDLPPREIGLAPREVDPARNTSEGPRG